MPLDLMLNLLWAAISLAALAGFCVLEVRRWRSSTGRARLYRMVAVLVVSLALFPSVSDSDDLFNFSFLHIPHGKHGGVGNAPPEESREKGNLQLARLLQTLEHVQISADRLALPAFAFVFLLAVTRLELRTRAVACRSSRAPPNSLISMM